MITVYYRLDLIRKGAFRWMQSSYHLYYRRDGKRTTFAAVMPTDPLINYNINFKADII